jgi:hypothetical protein
MKTIATAILAAIALALSACAGAPQTDSARQDAVNKITVVYAWARAAAATYSALPPCTDGAVSICSNPAIARELAKALVVADAAVNQAKAQILASGDQGNIEKWTGYALAAVDVLTRALATYGIK